MKNPHAVALGKKSWEVRKKQMDINEKLSRAGVKGGKALNAKIKGLKGN